MAELRFNYELVPTRRKNSFSVSLVLHVVGIILLLEIVQLLPAPRLKSPNSQVTLLYTPPVETKLAPKIVPPPPAVLAKLTPPKITVPAPDVAKIEPPRIEPKPVEVFKKVEPVAPGVEPKKEIVTGAFADNHPAVTPVVAKKEVVAETFVSGSSAPVTLQKSPRDVQTGGFGDPNGVKGNSERKGPVTVASLGTFELPRRR